MKRFQKLYPPLFALLLTAFFLYALLDAFVIRRVYTVVGDDPAETAVLASSGGDAAALLSAAVSSSSEPVITETSYCREGLTVTITTLREYDTDIYVADVWYDDPSVLATAFAGSCYGRNVTATASAIARDAGAVLAVNGDNYGSREKGYVIRNGVLYRDTAAKDQEDLVIWSDGSFSVIRESDVTAGELLDAGAVQTFSFGPALLEDGQISVAAADEVDRAMVSNPRTAVGLAEEGHLVLLVSDGRTSVSRGLTLYQLADVLQRLGVETAYNLDGGGSSTMVFNGRVVNVPTGGHGVKERAVTDILYIA